jgi:8-oxo-dGTP pyrophosphatase MutT (NUDIX family)
MDPTRAAGILFLSKDGRILLLKRGDGGDFPSAYCFPGGHAEGAETSEQTAERETIEELGFLPEGERTMLCRRVGPFPLSTDPEVNVDFTTYLQKVDEEFIPEVSGEHTGFCWAAPDALPEPMHPGCLVAIKMLDANELDIARLMSTGDLTSPQFYRNVALWAIRISGTRAAYRGGEIDEWCWRDPAHYTSPDAVARAIMPVIFEHPETSLLNSEEYAERNVGLTFLPYVVGEELWAIAKIYDDATIELLKNDQLSTSPGVTVSNATEFIHIDDGTKMLIEGEPLLFDHIAICEQGVWDKGGPPAGIISDNNDDEAVTMATEDEKAKNDAAEAARKDAAEKRDARMDAMLDKMDTVCAKVDAWEAKDKKDAEAAESEEEKKAKADAEKKDSEEKEAKEKEDAARKDVADLKAKVDAMEGKIPADLTDEESSDLADAQMKADSVYSAMGQSAPRPLAGESPLAYRRRTIAGVQKHSKTFKDSDLKLFDAATLKAVGETVFNDAVSAANSPNGQSAGIRYRDTKTPAGHTIRTPVGQIGSFLDQFRAQSKAAVLKHPSQVARGF